LNANTDFGFFSVACTAGPPSPVLPIVPVPAMVRITPFTTLRTRWWSESAM
jgi:hypothetical protein